MSNKLREALEAILKEPYGCRFCDSGKLRTENNPAKDHDYDCGYLLAKAALKEDGWISVNDRLPDDHDNEDVVGEQLIVTVRFNKKDFVSTGRIYMNEWYWKENNKKMSPEFKVTHWQALPLPPTTLTTKK